MGKIVTIELDPALADRYERAASEHGRSLEAELHASLHASGPTSGKDCAALLRLSDDALAVTPPDGPDATTSDSTLLIRWDRDTGFGHDLDDGWTDDIGH